MTPYRLILYSLIVLTGVVTFGLGAWSWLLRDGLGPNMIESHGLTAGYRFLAGFWPILIISPALFFGLWQLLKKSDAPQNAEQGA